MKIPIDGLHGQIIFFEIQFDRRKLRVIFSQIGLGFLDLFLIQISKIQKEKRLHQKIREREREKERFCSYSSCLDFKDHHYTLR